MYIYCNYCRNWDVINSCQVEIYEGWGWASVAPQGGSTLFWVEVCRCGGAAYTQFYIMSSPCHIFHSKQESCAATVIEYYRYMKHIGAFKDPTKKCDKSLIERQKNSKDTNSSFGILKWVNDEIFILGLNFLSLIESK